MRVNTESGNVVSSHSSAWGRSSFATNEAIDSRSASCSSVKMKCLLGREKSGRMTVSTGAEAMGGTVPDARTIGVSPSQAGGRK